MLSVNGSEPSSKPYFPDGGLSLPPPQANALSDPSCLMSALSEFVAAAKRTRDGLTFAMPFPLLPPLHCLANARLSISRWLTGTTPGRRRDESIWGRITVAPLRASLSFSHGKQKGMPHA